MSPVGVHARYVVLIGSTLVPQASPKAGGCIRLEGAWPSAPPSPRLDLSYAVDPRAVIDTARNQQPDAPADVSRRHYWSVGQGLVSHHSWYRRRSSANPGIAGIWGRHLIHLIHLGYRREKSTRGGRQNQEDDVETNGGRRDALSSSCNRLPERQERARCSLLTLQLQARWHWLQTASTTETALHCQLAVQGNFEAGLHARGCREEESPEELGLERAVAAVPELVVAVAVAVARTVPSAIERIRSHPPSPFAVGSAPANGQHTDAAQGGCHDVSSAGDDENEHDIWTVAARFRSSDGAEKQAHTGTSAGVTSNEARLAELLNGETNGYFAPPATNSMADVARPRAFGSRSVRSRPHSGNSRRSRSGRQTISPEDIRYAMDIIVQPPSSARAGYSMNGTIIVRLRTTNAHPDDAIVDSGNLVAVASLVPGPNSSVSHDPNVLNSLLAGRYVDNIHPFSDDEADGSIASMELDDPRGVGYMRFSELVIRQAGTYRIRITLVRIRNSSSDPPVSSFAGGSSVQIVDSNPIVVQGSGPAHNGGIAEMCWILDLPGVTRRNSSACASGPALFPSVNVK
ncbi:hypothetical protein K458DRAFT_433654 [Lentithecium fluviatile CBS 122367]|uniref:Velvet domain-containing protein n=1 Tax=Lentithecium fluviatile CBS 122367 TaxID=1168545 RepID=A0A6G1IUF0_9PLEO|nr:hypothetical protein K458DRAFT_433654 [Lentithecium fluviatile CBS 122367]